MLQANMTLRTAQAWYDLDIYILIIDADGWDRYYPEIACDFNTKLITHSEYVNRRNKCTVLMRRDEDIPFTLHGCTLSKRPLFPMQDAEVYADQ